MVREWRIILLSVFQEGGDRPLKISDGEGLVRVAVSLYGQRVELVLLRLKFPVVAVLCTSVAAVRDMVHRRQLLLVQEPGGEWVAPKWQFDFDGGCVVAGVEDLVAAISPEDDEAVALWADEPCRALENMRPAAVLKTYGDARMVIDAWL